MAEHPNHLNSSVELVETPELSDRLLTDIRRLLNGAFEGEFTDDDWDHTLGGHHAILCEGDRLMAHASVVERTIHVGESPFRAGYVEGVATRPDRNGEGFGTAVMGEITRLIRDEYEIGVLGTGRHSFYEHLGWERWRGPTYVREADGLRRSEDEDDGIMVLRCSPSRDIDLTAAISCGARAGDDW